MLHISGIQQLLKYYRLLVTCSLSNYDFVKLLITLLISRIFYNNHFPDFFSIIDPQIMGHLQGLLRHIRVAEAPVTGMVKAAGIITEPRVIQPNFISTVEPPPEAGIKTGEAGLPLAANTADTAKWRCSPSDDTPRFFIRSTLDSDLVNPSFDPDSVNPISMSARTFFLAL